jgi:tRNA pseudouridine55 synthase
VSRARSSHGVLLVDKAQGLSSHRVVAVTRRALGTREVGHGGTLDPMATGLLVLGVGEGTKLLTHLSGQDKRYVAELRLGSSTDSLDADGAVVASAALPDLTDVQRLNAALAEQLGDRLQVPPAVSAIKQQGVPLYERVRRGETVVPEARPVTLHALQLEVLSVDTLRLHVHSGKGYYVRALGRDLALALGSCGHLVALRRTTSGRFDVAHAVPFALLERAAAGDAEARQQVLERMLSLRAALAALPCVVLDEAGCEDARQGRVVRRERALSGAWPDVGSEPVALLSQAELPVALGRATERGLEVVRGFRYDA